LAVNAGSPQVVEVDKEIRMRRMQTLVPALFIAATLGAACTRASGDTGQQQDFIQANTASPPGSANGVQPTAVPSLMPPPSVALVPRTGVEADPAPPAAGQPTPAQPVDSPAAPQTDDESQYTLTATPPASAKVGSAATAELKLTPKSGYHVNTDAPIKVTITAPAGVTVAKAALDKTDAKQFDKTGADFQVGLTATAAGSSQVQVAINFVVCDDGLTECIPAHKSLSWQLSAQ
jgi:hypothetical protein